MIIKRLGLNNFGKFTNTDIKFNDGINVIYGKNEKGKTTLHQFIESFFTIHKEKASNKIKHYTPWENDSVFQGQLDLEINKKVYNLDADFNKLKLEVLRDKQAITSKDEFDQFTVMNLLGVQEMGSSNSKEFIREIQNKIVNIKNVNNMAIHYEEAVRDITERLKSLKNDSYYLRVEEDLGAVKRRQDDLIMEIDSLQISVENLFSLRNRLEVYNTNKAKILDSILVEEYEQLTKRKIKIEELNLELEELQVKIEGSELFNNNSMEEVNAYLDEVKEVNTLAKQIDETSGEITALKAKQMEMGLKQSDKAIKLMAEDMYANDFVLDVENYIKVENQLDELELSLDSSDFKKMQQTTEDAYRKEKELENDYMQFLNIRGKLGRIEQQSSSDHELIANKTKLDMLKLKGKPLGIYTVIAILLLIVSLITIVIAPQYLFVEGIFASFFFIITLVFVIMNYKNNQEINQLAFVVEQLKDELNSKKVELDDFKVELIGIYRKYGVEDAILFEQYYMQQKHSTFEKEDPKLKKINIENEVNELTFNKNMLYRRVRKWILDAELEESVSVEDKEEIIPFVEEHSKKCVEFMNINNDVFRFEYMVRQNNEAIASKKALIKSNSIYSMLRTYSLEEVQKAKNEYLSLISKQEKISEEVNNYLEKLSYESLTDKISSKENQIKDIDTENRIPGTIDELKGQLDFVKENISKTRSDINENMEQVSDLSLSKKRLIDCKRDIKRFEAVLNERDNKFAFAQKSLESIEKAADYIKETYTDDLSRSIGKVLYELTDIYNEVIITNDYEFFIKDKDKGRLIPIEQLSMGLLDQLYFAVRLGLMDTVNKNDKTPLVLDDCFVHYDDERLTNVLEVINKLKRQVIILTCQAREGHLLEQLQIKHTSIEL